MLRSTYLQRRSPLSVFMDNFLYQSIWMNMQDVSKIFLEEWCFSELASECNFSHSEVCWFPFQELRLPCSLYCLSVSLQVLWFQAASYQALPSFQLPDMQKYAASLLALWARWDSSFSESSLISSHTAWIFHSSLLPEHLKLCAFSWHAESQKSALHFSLFSAAPMHSNNASHLCISNRVRQKPLLWVAFQKTSIEGVQSILLFTPLM